jgi:glycosyltransferase involved in cell wall biosynthesis
MKFSVIVPSYNQHQFIEDTLLNLITLKKEAIKHGNEVEVLLFDSMSNQQVQEIIERHKGQLDYVEIARDNGQYDAINKGIARCTGTYWTWLNTDDLMDVDGFLKIAGILKADPAIDYIYGAIDYINDKGEVIRHVPSYPLRFDRMVRRLPGIFQQGSFFRKAFTDKVGLLRRFNCCFDYEYVLRCLEKGAKVHQCDFRVAFFRQHNQTKTDRLTPVFINEQLIISHEYGRKFWHFNTWFSYLRLLKHQLFPR